MTGPPDLKKPFEGGGCGGYNAKPHSVAGKMNARALVVMLTKAMKRAVHVMCLVFFIMLIFAVVGVLYFGEETTGDTEHWGYLGSTLLTIFGLVKRCFVCLMKKAVHFKAQYTFFHCSSVTCVVILLQHATKLPRSFTPRQGRNPPLHHHCSVTAPELSSVTAAITLL
ncbi:hypothetical protein MHYP_G00012780 [Metynnis hypsauchen]